MQTSPPPAPNPHGGDRYVVRLAGALAVLLGDVEVYEKQLVAMLGLGKVERLWQEGLITHPSPLLGRLLE